MTTIVGAITTTIIIVALAEVIMDVGAVEIIV